VARARAALLAARARRTRPARDEKQLAAWNGLALRALAHGALILGDARYAEATAGLVAFIRGHLIRDGAPVRVWRTTRDGRAHTPGFAEDHLALADGLLEAHATLGATEDLELALALGQTAIASFWDDVAGTFVDVAEEHGRGIATPRGLADNAVPSANSVGADVLLRLALLTGDDGLADRARSILRAVAPALDRSPSAFGRMLCAADRALGEPIDVVVAAGAGGDGRALRAAAHSMRPTARWANRSTWWWLREQAATGGRCGRRPRVRINPTWSSRPSAMETPMRHGRCSPERPPARAEGRHTRVAARRATHLPEIPRSSNDRSGR